MTSRSFAAIASALALAACAQTQGPVQTETVTSEYVRRGIAWQDTDVTTVVLVRLEQAGDVTRVCGAFFAEGEDFGRGEIENQVRGGARLAHGDRTVLRSLRAFSGPYPGLGRLGVEATCVTTTTPWRPEFDDPGPLRLDPPRVKTI
ncbi:MAG: hypothetical protein AAGI51_16330 [Pseudomonadota bacterium]